MTLPLLVHHPAEPHPGAANDVPDSRTVWMPQLARGLVAGAVTAAAVTGLLIGVGRRAGTPWRPLNAVAHTLAGARADQVWDIAGNVTLLGGAVVLAVSALAGIVTARLAPTNRLSHVAAAGGGVALTGYLLHLHVVARTPDGLAALLTVGELRGLYLTAGVALIAGMRFALHSGNREAGR